MKSMLAAFVALVVICIGAELALDEFPFSAQDTTSSADVRLDGE